MLIISSFSPLQTSESPDLHLNPLLEPSNYLNPFTTFNPLTTANPFTTAPLPVALSIMSANKNKNQVNKNIDNGRSIIESKSRVKPLLLAFLSLALSIISANDSN
jgi:hypothetical protein